MCADQLELLDRQVQVGASQAPVGVDQIEAVAKARDEGDPRQARALRRQLAALAGDP